MPIQIYRKFHSFQIKRYDIFYISAQNIDCGYSLEPPRRGGSNEYPQSMFLSRNKKNNFLFLLKNIDCTAKATHIFFFSKKFQHICVSLDVNFNESLTNDVVSFEQLDPDVVKSNK